MAAPDESGARAQPPRWPARAMINRAEEIVTGMGYKGWIAADRSACLTQTIGSCPGHAGAIG